MTEPKYFKPRLHDADANFVRRALCYLESQLTESEVQQLDAELRADPSKMPLLARLSLLRSALLEELSAGRASRPIQPPEAWPRHSAAAAKHTPVHRDFTELRSADMTEAMILEALQTTPDAPPAPIQNFPQRVKPKASKPAPRPLFLRSFWAYPGIAAVFVAAVSIWTAVMHRAAPVRRPPGPLTLTQSVNARWGGGEPIIKKGTQLPAGKLTLESGLAEVMFANGVRMIVQGPTTLNASSPRQLYLNSGRLVASVPHTDIGFAVTTPNGTVVDLGTEFGVAVRLHQPTVVNVLRGHVRAEALSPAGKVIASKVVAQYQAVKILAAATVHSRPLIAPTAPTPLAFVRPSQFAIVAQHGGYQRWRAFSSQLRSDPSLRAYYTFNNGQTAPNQLLNRAAATVGRYDGILGAPAAGGSKPLWSHGQWRQKGALLFSKARRTAVTLHVGPRFIPQHALTLAVWLRPNNPNLTGHIINESNGTVSRFDLVWLGSHCIEYPKNPMAFYFDWGGGPIITNAIAPTRPGWTLLVVTARKGGNVHFYINGRLRQSLPIAGPAAPHATTLLIGRPMPGINRQECWDGRLDELAIFNRELSGAEIANMYHAGRPGSGR